MTARLEPGSETRNQRGIITLSEIRQQPEVWSDTLERVAAMRVESIVGARAAVICGAGTSAYAASAVAAVWTKAIAIPTTDLLTYSKEELTHLAPEFVANGILVSLARSGDSPESVGVIERMKQIFPDVVHLAITCNEHGQLARMAGVETLVLDPRTNDRSLVMTGSFSNLLLAGMGIARGEYLRKRLPEILKAVKKALPELEKVAESLARGVTARSGPSSTTRVMVLTSAAMVPVGKEACLKILEMTAGRVVTINETFLGVRHGPMSFLRPDSLVLCVLSSDVEKRRYEEDLILELRQKKLGHLIIIGENGSNGEAGQNFVPAMAPDLPDDLRGPFEIIFPQLLAYYLSLEAHLDPDNPSPDGVITRVVQRFRLH
jgi:tagatose-6-phosphate ketose/aldose isomerase